MNYAEWAESFLIFAKTGQHIHGVSAEHDELWAGPPVSELESTDVQRLEELGWTVDPDGGFHTYV